MCTKFVVLVDEHFFPHQFRDRRDLAEKIVCEILAVRQYFNVNGAPFIREKITTKAFSGPGIYGRQLKLH